MKKSLRARLGLLVAGAALLVAPVIAWSQPKETDISLERQAATDLLAKLRTSVKSISGTNVELGEHPFHYVFLVDSSRAAMRSPETLFTRNVIGQLLKLVQANEDARNVAIENRSLVSLYPYQLDLYQTGPGVVQALEIGSESIAKVTDAVPQTYLPTRPDGKPYVNDPNKRRYDGHDNVKPRRDLLDAVGTETRNRPTLLIQITTNPLNEAPTDPKADAQIRAQQGRTGKLEGSGFDAYGMMQTASRHSPDAVQVHFWTYGPTQAAWRGGIGENLVTHAARGAKAPEPKKAAPPTKPTAQPKSSNLGWLVALVGILVVAGVAAWWLTAKASIVVEGVPATIKRGQDVAIVATGSQKSGRVVILPQTKAAGAPAGDLAILKLAGTGVQVEGRACTVSVSGGTAKSAIPLKPGPNGNQITLAVKGGFTTTISIKVLS